MFCHICGVETPDRSNFCWKCGASVKSEKAEEDKKKTVSFMAFKKRKEEERSSRFQPKKKLQSGSNSTSKAKGKEDTQVSINVGYMKFEDDKFKKCRGRTFPVKVPNCTSKRATPFNIHTPLCTRSIKFEPLRKKIKVPTQTSPQKLRNVCLTPQKKRKDQRMPMHTTPQKRLFQPPSEILVHRGVCILNGMAQNNF